MTPGSRMDPGRPPAACPLHGRGADPRSLVGRRITEVVASWRVYGTEAPDGPVEVWLRDDRGGTVRVTTGSDWCLTVEESAPHAGYDMGPSGRIVVHSASADTPFAPHVGRRVLAVREEHDPRTGRTGLELSFPAGRVRCATRSGDLALTGLPPDRPDRQDTASRARPATPSMPASARRPRG
ncbi:hypothetical protein [Streptomyces fradiae]|uniref:hypothetical protein n=1 Tax=Streptomyces fradiae TaxID=1906 RepID=UPI003511E7B0